MRVEFFGACFFCFCRIRFLEASTPCLFLPFVGHRICLAIRDKACIAGWHWTRGKSGPMTLFCLSNSGTHHFREALVEGQTQGFQRKHKQGPHNERAWLRKFATQGTGSLDGGIAVVNMFISQPTLVCPPLQKEKEQFCIGLCLRTTLPKSQGLVGGVEVSIVCLVQHETRHCRSCAFSCRVFGHHVKQQTFVFEWVPCWVCFCFPRQNTTQLLAKTKHRGLGSASWAQACFGLVNKPSNMEVKRKAASFSDHSYNIFHMLGLAHADNCAFAGHRGETKGRTTGSDPETLSRVEQNTYKWVCLKFKELGLYTFGFGSITEVPLRHILLSHSQMSQAPETNTQPLRAFVMVVVGKHDTLLLIVV